MLGNLFSEDDEIRLDISPKKWTVGEKALLASLPCWNGEGLPVRQWVRAWRQTKQHIDWFGAPAQEKVRCFKSKLQGIAWEWMIDQDPYETFVWTIEQWEAALVEAFAVGYHPSTAVVEFHVRKRGLDESVNTYAFALLRLAYQTGQMSRDDLAEAFIAGLGDEMAKEIRGNSEHMSFDEVWSRARAQEAKMNCLERYGVKVDRKCHSCGHLFGECTHKSPRVGCGVEMRVRAPCCSNCAEKRTTLSTNETEKMSEKCIMTSNRQWTRGKRATI